MKKVTLFFIALIATLQTQASHIIGGQITSRCLGGLTQEVTLTLYVDNQGLPMPNNVTITYNSNNYFWTVYNTIYQTSLYPINPTTNAYEFKDTITVPYIDYYTFSYSTCCRSAAITNISSASSPLYIESIIFADNSCNSTPIIPINPIPYVAINTQASYPLNAYDLDGDSLGYQLVTPLQDANLQVSGYALPPISISNNGVLSIFSSIMGAYDVCIKVTEYRNGIEIGHVLREIQILIDRTSDIDEIKNTNNLNYKNFYDILGRKVNNNSNSFKIHE